MSVWVRLSSVATLVRDAVDVRPDDHYKTLGILNRGRGVFERPEITGAETKYKRFFRVEPQQLVYSKLFAWEGAVAIVPSDVTGFVVSPEFPTFSLDGERVLPAYLAHVIQWEGFTRSLEGATTGMGQRRQRVNVDDFEAIEIPLPDPADQFRIASHLDKLAGVRERLMSRKGPLELRRDALIERAVGAGFSGERTRLGALLTPKPGEPVQIERDYPIAGVYSFGRGLLYRASLRGSDTKYKTLTRLDRGDVVYSKLGAFEGAVAVVGDAFAGRYVSPELPVFSRSSAVDPDFLRYCIIAESFAARLGAASTGVGARQKRVHPSKFLELDVPFPLMIEQKRITHTLGRLDGAHQLANRSEHLSKALLPAAHNEVFNAMR